MPRTTAPRWQGQDRNPGLPKPTAHALPTPEPVQEPTCPHAHRRPIGCTARLAGERWGGREGGEEQGGGGWALREISLIRQRQQGRLPRSLETSSGGREALSGGQHPEHVAEGGLGRSRPQKG